jgi:hypothetical protein
VSAKIAAMFAGDRINHTEQRADPAHSAAQSFRTSVRSTAAMSCLMAASPLAHARLRRRGACRQAARPHGQALTDVVNIGSGGSDLWPLHGHRSARALRRTIACAHSFPTSMRPTWAARLKRLNPEETLFIPSPPKRSRHRKALTKRAQRARLADLTSGCAERRRLAFRCGFRPNIAGHRSACSASSPSAYSSSGTGSADAILCVVGDWSSGGALHRPWTRSRKCSPARTRWIGTSRAPARVQHGPR